MPTYDYRCKSCGHAFELFQSMTAPVQRKCPECRKSTLERLIGTGAALLFKGSGFYETDYRSAGYKQAAEAEQKAASGTADTAKPAAAAESKPPAQPATPAAPAKAESSARLASGAPAKVSAGTGQRSAPAAASKPAAKTGAKPAARGRGGPKGR